MHRDNYAPVSSQGGRVSSQGGRLERPSRMQFDRILSKDLATGFDNGMTSTSGRELSNDMSLSLANHGKPVQQHRPGHISTRSWEPPPKGETFDAEYCPPAALNYNLTLDKTVKKQARIKAKMHLLSVGCRFEFKARSRGRHDVRYISPTGQNYYYLLQACLAWKQQQKVRGVIDGNHEDNVEDNAFWGVFLHLLHCRKLGQGLQETCLQLLCAQRIQGESIVHSAASL